MVVADFNNDGKLDLAVADYGAAKLSVFLGNGDGTFGTRGDYAVGSNPYFLAAADLNGDGKLDLAVANYSSATVSVLVNKGDGTGTFRDRPRSRWGATRRGSRRPTSTATARPTWRWPTTAPAR